MSEIKEKKMICLSPEIMRMVEQASQEDCRSFSNMVEYILIKYFKK